MTMPLLFAIEALHFVFGTAMFVTSLFLILLVLVQRGRGGGLSGALGGAGGQSAFGAKAGDTFTRVTMVAAGFWILLCAASIVVLQGGGSKFGNMDTGGVPFVGDGGGDGADLDGGAGLDGGDGLEGAGGLDGGDEGTSPETP